MRLSFNCITVSWSVVELTKAVKYFILKCSCPWGETVSELRPPTGLLFIPRWYMSMESHGGIILTGENRRTRRKTCPTDTLSTTNPTWTDPGANCGLRGGRPATNHLSHGTAHVEVYVRRFFSVPVSSIFEHMELELFLHWLSLSKLRVKKSFIKLAHWQQVKMTRVSFCSLLLFGVHTFEWLSRWNRVRAVQISALCRFPNRVQLVRDLVISLKVFR
jgi:hypothetical protein